MKVKELMELLSKCPQEDILMAEVVGVGYVDVTDVLVGHGTVRGLSYLQLELCEDELD